jgi:hypothetical protein
MNEPLEAGRLAGNIDRCPLDRDAVPPLEAVRPAPISRRDDPGRVIGEEGDRFGRRTQRLHAAQAE